MISNQDDEFVAVRVQDPRIQNEGSWNSYVDYKIFLHTNSKAFTAKTSCVRRRYSEFAWLKKKLQKNAGLVPVPDLPGKSFFSFSNEDFLEGRRKGLQSFLDKVVNMTVCLSDSQLHLFLQTQLPVGHIQDCVQGHTPYSVTDAILTYASSNQGLAQAQEEDANKEPSLTVSYESMESPAPHQPCPQLIEPLGPPGPDPLKDLLEDCEQSSSVVVLQRNNHLEARADGCSFFLGSSPGRAEPTEQRSGCQIQTPVEVHSPSAVGLELEDVCSGGEDAPDAAPPGDCEILVVENHVSCEGEGPELVSSCSQESQNSDSRDKGREEQPEEQQEVVEEDRRSLPSSNGSIVKVSDEESEAEESGQLTNGYMDTCPGGNILALHMNGCPPAEEEEDEEEEVKEEEDLQYLPDIAQLSKALDLSSTLAGGDQTENSDFSVLECSCSPGTADSKHPERDAPEEQEEEEEEAQEVEAR